MIYLLILFPLVMAAVTFAVPSDRWRPWLLPAGGAGAPRPGRAGRSSSRRRRPAISGLGGWLLLDALGKVVLGFLSVLFFLCSLYAPGYLALRSDRPNRVFCANLFAVQAMMTLVTLSHHLGLMWVAMEATTLASAPSHLLQPQRPLAGGDLEVPADLLGGHRPGPARLVLPGLLVAQGRPGIDAALRPAHRGRPAALAALAARGVRAAVRRLRDQDGPGPDAHLEARRLRRGAGHGRHAARRRRHQLRLPGDPAGLPDLPRRGRSRVRPGDHDLHGPAVDGRRRGVHGPPARLQADAGLLQRRAHGHPGAGHRHRRPGRLRRPAAPDQQRADQGRAVPLGGQHPPGLRQQAHRRRAGGHPARAALGGAVPGRLPGHHRLAAVRPVRQRVHDRERRGRQRAVPRRAACSCSCSASCSSAWGPPSWPWSRGTPPERTRGRPAFATASAPAGRSSSSWRSCCCWASTSRRPWSRCCARRPRSWR